MKVVIQRVNHASVKVSGKIAGAIQKGLCLLIGFGPEDHAGKLGAMADKIAHLRIFPNAAGRFDRSVLEVGGGVLLVPQFTLYADTRKGRRPDFFGALAPAAAAPLFEQFVDVFTQTGVNPVEAGVFGAEMQVALENDGPVTIILEL